MVFVKAVVPGYYLVCYNPSSGTNKPFKAVVPGYYLVCYNPITEVNTPINAVVPGYYLSLIHISEPTRPY